MKRIVSIFLIFIGCNQLFAQENPNALKVLISSRVDTSSNQVKAIIKLYEQYYNSKPDSIYDNPYWNKKEKEQYRDFDFSRESIFQGNMEPEMLFRYFSPFVMSVEPIGEKYQIRVLFSSSITDPKYAGPKVWCIQKLNAIKEDGIWVFENLIVELSENWSSKKIGVIEYIYPPKLEFDFDEAKQAEKFCNRMIKRFNPDFNEPFKYYVMSSIDDMGLLENFDYYFVGMTTGKTREGMILTANGNENYPHEFVHKLLPYNENRGEVIEEGLATFLGTKESDKEYAELLNKLATDLRVNSERINFSSTISQTASFNGYQTAYPAGAAICELVFEKRGDKGLTELLMAKTRNYDEIVSTVCSITKLTDQEFEKEWTEIIKNYYRP